MIRRHFFRETKQNRSSDETWFKFKLFTLAADIGSKSFGALALLFQVLCHRVRRTMKVFFARGVKLTQVSLKENVKVLNTDVFQGQNKTFTLTKKQEELSIFFLGNWLPLLLVTFMHDNVITYSYNYNNVGIIHENIAQRTVLKRRKVALQDESITL